jgi:hypothetical protein
MTNKVYPEEVALNRLLERNKDLEARERAQRLGRVIERVTAIAKEISSMQYAGSQLYEERFADGAEFKLARFIGAHVDFVVDEKFDGLQHTAEWLPNAHRVELALNHYDFPLPEDMDKAPDAAKSTTIRLTPQTEVTVEEGAPQPYDAAYEEGNGLDIPDIESTIGILIMIADQMEAQQSR